MTTQNVNSILVNRHAMEVLNRIADRVGNHYGITYVHTEDIIAIDNGLGQHPMAYRNVCEFLADWLPTLQHDQDTDWSMETLLIETLLTNIPEHQIYIEFEGHGGISVKSSGPNDCVAIRYWDVEMPEATKEFMKEHNYNLNAMTEIY